MPSASAQRMIGQLGLSRHPEGGWFRETYRSTEQLAASALPERFGGERSCCTSIYFLLEQGDFSSLHRIKSDEIWHFHSGCAVLIHIIADDGAYQTLRLGPDTADGELFQAVAPAGCWFGAEVAGQGFALVGCTVAPGFDFADFELGRREELTARYPELAALVRRLTRA